MCIGMWIVVYVLMIVWLYLMVIMLMFKSGAFVRYSGSVLVSRSMVMIDVDFVVCFLVWMWLMVVIVIVWMY